MQRWFSLVSLCAALTALATSPMREPSAMELALASKDLAALRALLADHHSPDLLTFMEGSPLARAIQTGRLDQVTLLLSYRANVTVQPRSIPPGWTLRCWARLWGEKFERALEAAGAATNPGCEREVAWLQAVRKQDRAGIKAGPGAQGISLSLGALALSAAIDTGKAAMVEAVVAASGNPRLAAAAGASTYERGIDPDLQASLILAGASGPSLEMALEDGNHRLAAKLAAALADPDHSDRESGPLPLVAAIQHESVPTVLALIKRGASVNAIDHGEALYLWTLHFAHHDLVRAVLTGKPDLSLIDREGKSGFELAAATCDGSLLEPMFHSTPALPAPLEWPVLKNAVACSDPRTVLAVLSHHGLNVAEALKGHQQEIWRIANWGSPQRKLLYKLGLPVQPN